MSNCVGAQLDSEHLKYVYRRHCGAEYWIFAHQIVDDLINVSVLRVATHRIQNHLVAERKAQRNEKNDV